MIGRQISHFYIIRMLGSGGMGVVYEAQDTRLPRSVAIKVLKDELARDTDAIKRFKREARLASSLNHPNVCTILEVSDDDAQPFIAMELLEGTSLKSRLLGNPLSLAAMIDIGRQVADALGAAHAQGIIHRDITPGNIFLSSSGLVKLLDFGLAKHFSHTAGDGQTTDDLTSVGAVAGTVHYMSPEQLADSAPVDARCDFFAFGAVLYQMATGARPFDHVSRTALIAAIQLQPHMPLRQLAPHHPIQLERIVDTLLAKRPEDRYQSAAALRAALDVLHRGTTTPQQNVVPASQGRVRVTVTMVDDTEDTPPLLVIDRSLDDVMRKQDEIGREVSDGLRAALSRMPMPPYSQEPEAYHAFKRGQHLWKSCFEGGWRPAIEQFQHAIERDPQFAQAQVALARAYNFLGFYCLVKPNLAFAVAGRAAERALTITPTLGAGYLELALAKFGGEWDWDGAEEAFRRAIALDATNALSHVHYSWLLMLLGREPAALAEAHSAHALAPSSRFVAAARAQTMYLAGRYTEAVALCNECLSVTPDYLFAIHMRGLCHLVESHRDAAIADLEQAAALSHRVPYYLGLLGRCYGEFGMRDRALDLVAELKALPADTYVPPQCFVFIYAALGERERALFHQEQAYADGAPPFNYLFPGVRELYALAPHHKKRLEQMRLAI